MLHSATTPARWRKPRVRLAFACPSRPCKTLFCVTLFSNHECAHHPFPPRQRNFMTKTQNTNGVWQRMTCSRLQPVCDMLLRMPMNCSKPTIKHKKHTQFCLRWTWILGVFDSTNNQHCCPRVMPSTEPPFPTTFVPSQRAPHTKSLADDCVSATTKTCPRPTTQLQARPRKGGLTNPRGRHPLHPVAVASVPPPEHVPPLSPKPSWPTDHSGLRSGGSVRTQPPHLLFALFVCLRGSHTSFHGCF